MPSIKRVPVADLIPYARNSRTHNDAQVAQIAASIREFGWTNPVLVDAENGIIAGHGRVLAARKLGMDEVPVIVLDGLTDAQKRAYIIADNKLALNAGWDDELLALEITDLKNADFDLDLLGFTDDELDGLLSFNPAAEEDGTGEGEGSGAGLSERFMIAPFSVLNAREGWWQERKKAWIAGGLSSEVGRGENLLKFSDTAKIPSGNGTSIFDPVLCELAYRWFTPPGGMVIDPFAGGSVRGVVAARLGLQYVGVDLRAEQVEANRVQGEDLCANDPFMPVWHCGDSRRIASICSGVQADFIFSCPPYADLEVYSDDPADLSTLGYDKFRDAYFEIIKQASSLLKRDRFAVFVVGEVRDKKGAYYDFVGDTVQAFRDAGLEYYNEAILVTMVGSLPIRAGKQFSVSRKLGKTHQNVLVFVKGDAKAATKACGPVVVDESLFGDETGD